MTMLDQPWRAVPPPSGNRGNPWTVADETGETIVIIPLSTYGSGELIAKQIVKEHNQGLSQTVTTADGKVSGHAFVPAGREIGGGDQCAYQAAPYCRQSRAAHAYTMGPRIRRALFHPDGRIEPVKYD